MPHPLILVFSGIFGALFGSFLNVCIVRWPTGESVVRPRSRCPRCGRGIGWRENIPIFSWIALRGRCRECGEPISLLYPAVEAATALIWVGAFAFRGLSWEALTVAVFFTILLGIAVTDARTYTIPDQFSLGGLAIGLALAPLPGGITAAQAVLGAAAGFGILYGVAILGEWWLKKQAMGGGDIKMLAMIGAFVGPVGVLLTLFMGALAGTLVYLPLSLRSRRLVPFGIFLAIGAVLTVVWGEGLVGWYVTEVLGR